MELRIEKFYTSVTREEISGPDNMTFKKLKSTMELPDFEIDTSKLCYFSKSSVIETIVNEGTRKSAKFCNAYLSSTDDVHTDRRELAELVPIPGGGQDTQDQKTRCSTPC